MNVLMKFLLIPFTILFFTATPLFAQEAGEQLAYDIEQVDSSTAVYRLWEALEIDTFVYHVAHDNTEKLAMSSLLKLIALGVNRQPTAEDIRQHYARAYVDNFLAKKDTVLDFLELNVAEQFPSLLVDLNGHIGLRRYLSCYNQPTDSCQSIRLWGLSYIQEAAKTSEIMPKEQWQWLAKRIEEKLPYERFDDQLELVDIDLDDIAQPDWEGALVSFSRKAGKSNLLYTNGSRFPLKILEWNADSKQWDDSTAATGLENYPGGYRLYAGDINNDGHEDLIVLRSASSRRSPAKLFPSVFINQKDGTFEDITLELGLDTLNKPQCACIGDYNGDGRNDLYFGGLKDESKMLLQNADNTFTDRRYVYGMDEFAENVQDCIFFDFNQDGKKDLLLSMHVFDNKVYIQGLTNDGKYIYFGDQAEEYQLSQPTFGGSILSGPNRSSAEDVMFLSDISERYDVLPHILSSNDSIVKDTSYYLSHVDGQLQKKLLPKELSLYRAGIWVSTFDGMRLLYSGGKTPETILPYFEYNSNTNEVKVAYIDELPLYVSSAAVIEQDGQPLILFKGGGDYPVMKSTVRAVSYRPDNHGSYHKIFDFEQEEIFSTVDFHILDTDGNVYARSVVVQAKDSRGNHAMQEWIWLPDGYQVLKGYEGLPDQLSEKELRKLLKKERKRLKRSKR